MHTLTLAVFVMYMYRATALLTPQELQALPQNFVQGLDSAMSSTTSEMKSDDNQDLFTINRRSIVIARQERRKGAKVKREVSGWSYWFLTKHPGFSQLVYLPGTHVYPHIRTHTRNRQRPTDSCAPHTRASSIKDGTWTMGKKPGV